MQGGDVVVELYQTDKTEIYACRSECPSLPERNALEMCGGFVFFVSSDFWCI